MEIANLGLLARAARKSQSDLARMAGVSRQAVSLWFRNGGFSEVKSGHLKRLAVGLGVKADDLLMTLDGYGDADRRTLTAELLWDALYPDLDAFVVALADGEPRALARLVERVGLFEGARIAGEAVWESFPRYSRFVPAARRRGLEGLWTFVQSQTER